jgi:hypothetical protein
MILLIDSQPKQEHFLIIIIMIMIKKQKIQANKRDSFIVDLVVF